MATIEDRLTLIEQQLAMQTEAMKRIVEGRWPGADGAAGILVALMGGNANVTPADFPPKD